MGKGCIYLSVYVYMHTHIYIYILYIYIYIHVYINIYTGRVFMHIQVCTYIHMYIYIYIYIGVYRRVFRGIKRPHLPIFINRRRLAAVRSLSCSPSFGCRLHMPIREQ